MAARITASSRAAGITNRSPKRVDPRGERPLAGHQGVDPRQHRIEIAERPQVEVDPVNLPRLLREAQPLALELADAGAQSADLAAQESGPVLRGRLDIAARIGPVPQPRGQRLGGGGELGQGARIGPRRRAPFGRPVISVDIALVALAHFEHELDIVAGDGVEAVAPPARARGAARQSARAREKAARSERSQVMALHGTGAWRAQTGPGGEEATLSEISCALFRANPMICLWSDSGEAMGGAATVLALLDFVMRETALFAACGFLLFGLSDLAVDLLWIGLRLARRRRPPPGLPVAQSPGRLAIFVPAWDEAAVIGEMLAHAQGAFGAADYLLYVGCYPNDPATIAAVRAAAGPRLRLVVGPAPGPTSKADCLNRLWERMVEDEAADGFKVKAVVLHDAEDVVHSAELALFDALIERFDLVQLPVLPLADPGSRFIGGHYIDEFCEAHGKELVVRAAIGASLPSAGVGCAVSRAALAALAEGAGRRSIRTASPRIMSWGCGSR